MQYQPLLHVVLFQPEIPPNTGNIGRSCVAIGAKLWLIKPLGFQINEKELRRAGLDYWPFLEWQTVENWAELAEHLAEPLAKRRIWLLTKRGRTRYSAARFERGDILLFGCETSGLPEELTTQFADRTLRIPMRPQVRSLNLSSSAALVMYEAIRQLNVADEFDEISGE